MVKITEDLIDKPYFKEIGSIIYNYPCNQFHTSCSKDEFQLGEHTREYRIIDYNKFRDVLNLVTTHSTDRYGASRTNPSRLELTNGFWWYDPFQDISEEVEQLFDKFFEKI